MRLDDGQADGDELAEELEDLLRGHHVLLPDDVLHLQQRPISQEPKTSSASTRSSKSTGTRGSTYPDPRSGLLPRLEQLGDVPPHLAELQLPPVPQQLDPRDRQLQQRLAAPRPPAHSAREPNQNWNHTNRTDNRSSTRNPPTPETEEPRAHLPLGAAEAAAAAALEEGVQHRHVARRGVRWGGKRPPDRKRASGGGICAWGVRSEEGEEKRREFEGGDEVEVEPTGARSVGARSTRRGHLLHCARDRDRPLPTRGRRIGDPRCLFPGGVLSG